MLGMTPTLHQRFPLLRGGRRCTAVTGHALRMLNAIPGLERLKYQGFFKREISSPERITLTGGERLLRTVGRGRADRESAQLKGLEKQNKTKHKRAEGKRVLGGEGRLGEGGASGEGRMLKLNGRKGGRGG